jgi:hypothetical protein
MALRPALIGGLITATATALGGPRGVEGIFRGAGGKELVRKTLLEQARMLGIDITEEALEEGADQFLQGILAKFHHHPDKTSEEIITEAVHAAKIGALLGGGVSGAKEGCQWISLWGKDGRLNEELNGGETLTPPRRSRAEADNWRVR